MHGDANITGAASGAVLRVSERLWLPDKEYYVILLYLLALLTLARLSGQCNFAPQVSCDAHLYCDIIDACESTVNEPFCHISLQLDLKAGCQLGYSSQQVE